MLKINNLSNLQYTIIKHIYISYAIFISILLCFISTSKLHVFLR